MLTSRLVLSAALLLLPALSPAADDPPFNVKNKLTIPFSGSAFYEPTGENVNVSGDVDLKLGLSFRTGPVKIKAIAKLKNVVATGQTSGDPYRVRGQSKMQLSWPGGVTDVDVTVAMEGDPIPGLDVKIGGHGLVAVHVDTDPTNGTATGSSATVQGVPASASITPALQVTTN